jgi:hypothetical protein
MSVTFSFRTYVSVRWMISNTGSRSFSCVSLRRNLNDLQRITTHLAKYPSEQKNIWNRICRETSATPVTSRQQPHVFSTSITSSAANYVKETPCVHLNNQLRPAEKRKNVKSWLVFRIRWKQSILCVLHYYNAAFKHSSLSSSIILPYDTSIASSKASSPQSAI